MKSWTVNDIGSQKGKLAIVTGGTDGLGLATAKAIAHAGAHVIIAANHEDKGQRAVREIRGQIPTAAIEFEKVDMSDLNSVEDFANRMRTRHLALDLLINNAGVAGIAKRRLSAQGFELTLATNYLGHFALTGRLLPLLIQSRQARVVHVSSLVHQRAKIHFDDLQLTRRYEAHEAYGQSKLAVLMLTLELHRRLQRSGLSMMSLAAHPGGAKTNIFDNGASMSGEPHFKSYLLKWWIELFGQSAEQGALPILFAATSFLAESGLYYGPNGFNEVRGAPAIAKVSRQAKDQEACERLWTLSEQLTGVIYPMKNAQISSSKQIGFRNLHAVPSMTN